LKVKVSPRARIQGIEKKGPGEYKLRVLSPPSKGEANREVIEILASHFGLPSSRVKILRGQKSHNKLVSLEIEEEDRALLERRINLKKGKN
jgi:hypothetical protein